MLYTFFALVSFVIFDAALPAPAYASVCGDPPPVQDETLAGEIQGRAQFLSRFLGDASLGGRIQTARTEIFSKYRNAEQWSDAYFAYQVCILLMEDATLSATQKIDKLVEIRREFSKSTSGSNQPAASSSVTVGTGIGNLGGTQTFQDDVNIDSVHSRP